MRRKAQGADNSGASQLAALGAKQSRASSSAGAQPALHLLLLLLILLLLLATALAMAMMVVVMERSGSVSAVLSAILPILVFGSGRGGSIQFMWAHGYSPSGCTYVCCTKESSSGTAKLRTALGSCLKG